MISADELAAVPIFSPLSDEWRSRIAAVAAEIRVSDGDWIIREGETSSFFVLLEGCLKCEKDYGGTNKIERTYQRGDFYGEIPILLDCAAIASLRAIAPSRLLRMDRTLFQDMLAACDACKEIVTDVMAQRLKQVTDHLRSNEALRIHVVGSRFDDECRDVRTFLAQNNIAYRWSDCDLTELQTPAAPFAVVDQCRIVHPPLTVRRVADALGLGTSPRGSSYDLVIVGGGPAGLAAAVYGSSEGLSTLLIEKAGIGGQAACSTRIENYPGFPTGIAGSDLGSKAFMQANAFGAEIVMTREVSEIRPVPEGFRVGGEGGCSVHAKSVLLATGVQWRKLRAPGFEALTGKGILYGPSRTEGDAVVGENVFVVGGGNSAGQAAIFFADYAASVTLLVRGPDINRSMSRYLVLQLQRRSNVRIEVCTSVISAHGDDRLETIVTERGGVLQTRRAAALFLMIGAETASGWLPAELQRDPHGYVYTGRDVVVAPDRRIPFALETSVPGLFCAGDIRHGSIKRVSSGVGEGAVAVSFIHRYLASEGSSIEAMA